MHGFPEYGRLYFANRRQAHLYLLDRRFMFEQFADDTYFLHGSRTIHGLIYEG